MDRETYLRHLRDVTSGDPTRVREANRSLYFALVVTEGTRPVNAVREADLVLAEAPQAVLH